MSRSRPLASPGERLRAAGVTLGLSLAILSPLWRSPPRDSFPLSSYPMFATPREQAGLDLAQTVSQGGVLHPVPPRLLGGDEVLQAAATVAQAVRSGEAGAARLCRELAAAMAHDPDGRDVVRVEIAHQRWDPVATLAEGLGPLERRVVASCPVAPR